MYQIEHTDTFSGEANYCWVNRYMIRTADIASDNDATELRRLVRTAKRLTGLTGVRCDVDATGELITIRPRNLAQIVFVRWTEED